MAEVNLLAIIGLIVGVMLTLGVLAFGAAMLGLWKQEADEGSYNNFNGLVMEIKNLIANEDDFASRVREFYLKNDLIIVGYNYNKDKQHTDCSDEDAIRPLELLGKPGICLHVEDYWKNFDKDPQEPLKCTSFDEKLIFLAPYDNNDEGGFGGSKVTINAYGKSENYEDLFLYGSECDSTYDLGSTRLYIEKYKKGDEIYIYVNEHSTEEQQKANLARFERLKKELLKL